MHLPLALVKIDHPRGHKKNMPTGRPVYTRVQQAFWARRLAFLGITSHRVAFRSLSPAKSEPLFHPVDPYVQRTRPCFSGTAEVK